MKDKAYSIKTAEGYKTIGGIKQGKYGEQAYLTPDGHKLLNEWLKAPASYFNMNIKEFEPRGANTSKPAAAYDDSSEMPF